MYLFNPYIIHIFPYILFYWYIRILMLSIYFIVFIRIIDKYIDMLSIYFGILTILMIIHILSVLHIWYHIIHCIYMYLCYWYIIHIFSYFSLYWYIRILMLSIYFIVFIRIIEKYIDMLSIYFGILTIYSWLSIYYQYYIYDIIFLIWIIYYVFILLIYYPYGMLMDNPPNKKAELRGVVCDVSGWLDLCSAPLAALPPQERPALDAGLTRCERGETTGATLGVGECKWEMGDL